MPERGACRRTGPRQCLTDHDRLDVAPIDCQRRQLAPLRVPPSFFDDALRAAADQFLASCRRLLAKLPDPAFAKIVVLTTDAEAREALRHRLREAESQGLAPEAYVRVTQLVFGPYTPFPVEFRVMGPDPAQLYSISEKALDIMRGVPGVRQANRDWGNRTPVLRFIPDQDRLNLVGLSPAEVGEHLQLLFTGIAITQVREDIRNVPVVARSWIRRDWRISH